MVWGKNANQNLLHRLVKIINLLIDYQFQQRFDTLITSRSKMAQDKKQ
jgi:hypothetical protein